MTDDSPPRERIEDRYRVTRRIGSGGLATVWRAVDERGGPDVAVKFPRWTGSNDESVVRAQFERAYETLSTIERGIHPTSLVHFLDGQLEEPTYLVTEYVSGEGLAAAVAEQGTGVDLVEKYGVPVARALSFLHRNGRMYLDIKPENVLVRRESDRPVLVDFNTAESIEGGTTVFREDPYKAPEQLPGDTDGEDSSPRSDVYGLGKLFVYLLTGRTFRTTATPAHGIDVQQYDPSVPDPVAGLVESATRAAPADRPATATKFVTQLYSALNWDDALATITDRRNDVRCPVRVGDTVGRVTDDAPLPTVAVVDRERYVSPVQFEVRRNDGWVVEDCSLNGTYLETDDGWQLLLSTEGYERLQAESEAPDEQPYTAARISVPRLLVPVDPSYSIRLRFEPRPKPG